MSDPIESRSRSTPVTWRQAGLLALIAVACFHAAYTTAQSGLLAFAIVGYVICLVQLARLRTTRQCFYVTLAVGFACFAPQLGFFWNIFGPAAIALWLILALWLAAFGVITHVAIVQLGWKRAAFLTPFFWTGLEYFRSELYYLKFSWLNAGYAFAESSFIPWQYAGVYGSGFAIVTIAAGFLLVRREHLYRIRRLHVLLFATLAALMTALLLPSFAKAVIYPNLIVAGAQLEFPNENEIIKTLDSILVQDRQRVKKSPYYQRHTNLDLVVLPEYTLDGEPTDALKDWCRTHQKFLIVGGKQSLGDTNYYNTAFVISTNGQVVFTQVKSVPIQFFKDGLPAPEQKVWDSPWGKIGICICYDLSYTRVTDPLVRQGARMLIVPTMDVETWGQHQHELHARIAPVRAAEYGIPIFRVASSGISQGVEKTGRVQSSAPFSGEGETIFFGAHLGAKGNVPPDRLLAPLCVFVTIVFVIRTFAATLWRKRTSS
jgi:apolipoprotein N-acyltransferase